MLSLPSKQLFERISRPKRTTLRVKTCMQKLSARRRRVHPSGVAVGGGRRPALAAGSARPATAAAESLAKGGGGAESAFSPGRRG
ncbi:unnamed protein product, partial [Iphiclides podalirius]